MIHTLSFSQVHNARINNPRQKCPCYKLINIYKSDFRFCYKKGRKWVHKIQDLHVPLTQNNPGLSLKSTQVELNFTKLTDLNAYLKMILKMVS